MDKTNEASTQSQSTHTRTGGTFHYLQVIIGVALVIATLFTAWTSADLLPSRLVELQVVTPQGTIAQLIKPTATIRPRPLIGIVAGHWSKDPKSNDPGAVCPNGKTEVEINQEIATKVQEILKAQGYDVDLLEEWDPRLTGYRALALVSIHADSCEYINDQATGFKVAASLSNPHPELSNRLVACIQNRYAQATGLKQHQGSVTGDMTFYHAFSEIHNETPAAIIETGFLNLDYQVLTQKQDSVAGGIANGILCFIRNEDVSPQITATP